MKINRIAVIGAGNMGHQIALHAAISGFKVKCFDINPETLKKANQFVDDYLPGRVAKRPINPGSSRYGPGQYPVYGQARNRS